jgi:hypothetical protein
MSARKFMLFFGFCELAEGIARAIGHEPPGDFAAACNYVNENYSLENLMLATLKETPPRRKCLSRVVHER